GDGIVERPRGLFDWGVLIPDVHPVDVDVVRSQPAQAGLQRQPEVLAMAAATVRVGRVPGHGVLRGQHEPLAATNEQLPQDFLARAAAVVDGRVDDIATSVGVRIEDAPALLDRSADAALLAERHRTEYQLRYAQTGPAERRIPHANVAATYAASSSAETSRRWQSIAQRCPDGSRNCAVRSPQNASCGGSNAVAPAAIARS